MKFNSKTTPTSETQIATPKTNLLALGLLLAGLPSLSSLILIADSKGFVSVLGWSRNPGYFFALALLGLSIFAWVRHEPPPRICFSLALFLAPMCLDQICDIISHFANIFPLPAAVWLGIAFAPLLTACFFVNRMKPPFMAKLAFLFVGAGIGSVHLYNEFNPGQHMGFFSGGWTT